MKLTKNNMMVAAMGLSMLGATAATTVAQADEGDVLVRVRAIDILPRVASSSTLATLDPHVTSQPAAEVDFTYFALKNLGVELIVGTTNHDVSAGALGPTAGSQILGTVGVLPPTLTAQWHFLPDSVIRPYVGAGVNFTWFYNVKLAPGVDIDRTSFGPALQAGLDYQLTKNVFVNADIKKLWINTDVKLDGSKIGNLAINPLVVGLGIGTKF